mgnify:CR=1 FL=1
MQIKTNEFQKEIKEHGDFYFPFLVSKEKLSLYESGTFLWHWHPEIELTLISKGKMAYKVNHDSFILTQGQALFGNSNTLHTGYMLDNIDCEYYSITFEPKLIYGYDNSNVYIKYIKPILQNYSLSAIHFDNSLPWHQEIIQIIKNIIKIELKKYSAYELDIHSYLSHFWKILFLNNNITIDVPSDKNKYDRIRDIVAYIEKNYATQITLDDISQSIHICKSECSRFFKKYMNITLFEFISQYRIEKSINYLINTNYSIIEIANLVGYNDSNYYAKVFHKIKGCSPKHYRHNVHSNNSRHT